MVDGDNSYNDPYSLKNSLSNNDILSQQQQLQIANHIGKASKQHGLPLDPSQCADQLEYSNYAKLDFANELLKSQVLNQAMQTNSPSLVGGLKQSRVNVVSTGTTDNLQSNLTAGQTDQQSLNANKFESTV